MAHFTLQVAPHLDYESLTKRVRECQDPIEKNRWLAIQLLNQPDKPMTTQQVAITLNYSAGWVRQQVQRYNCWGAEGLLNGWQRRRQYRDNRYNR